MGQPKKVALCCIVRDEEKVIERLLRSVAPLIDFAVIVDTGSVDNTEEVAIKILEEINVPYEFSHEEWEDFSHNRNIALEKLRKYRDIDYCFTIDADEVLSIKTGFDSENFKKSLTKDLYHVRTLFEDTLYDRTLLFNNKKKFYYKGVLHEFINCDEGYTTGKAHGIKVVVNTDGKRSTDKNKFEKDTKLLEEALKEEEDPHMISRYTFYLAQSYRDCGNLNKAIENYKKRITLGFFGQEIFESLYNITKAKAKLNHPVEEVIDAGLRAYSFQSERIEPMHEIVKYCRLKKQFNLGYFLGKERIDFVQPKEALFKIHWVYDWGFWDEVAICAFYSDKKKYAIDLWKRALGNKSKIPNADVDRINNNIDYAIKNM